MHQPEDVGLELAADVVQGHRLDGAALAVAGVVDEHPDGAFGLLDRVASTAVRIEDSSVTSSASVTQPLSARSSIDSTRRAVA